MHWDRWVVITYPPTDAEFHESFDNLEAAHLSPILLRIVITTTIVDTDYSHGPYQRPWPAVQRHGDWSAASKCPLPAVPRRPWICAASNLETTLRLLVFSGVDTLQSVTTDGRLSPLSASPRTVTVTTSIVTNDSRKISRVHTVCLEIRSQGLDAQPVGVEVITIFILHANNEQNWWKIKG